MKRVELIDFFKGFSIGTIVIMHLIQNYLNMPNYIYKAALLGGAGVHVFIFCSGFGLYYSYVNNPIKYKCFLKRRLLKIYFPYIFVVIISSLIPFLYSGSDKIIAVLSHIFLFKMFFEKYECSFGCQLWFISTIIQFYLIFYVLLYFKGKINNNKIFIAFSLFISIFWWIFICIIGKSDVRVYNSFFLQYLWEFSLGIVFADNTYRNNGEYSMPKNIKIIVISLICLLVYALLGLKGGIFKNFNDIPSLFGYSGVVIYLYKLNIKIVNKAVMKMSSFSYELYLLHICIFSCVFKLLGNNVPLLIAMIALILSLFIAKLYNYMVLKVSIKIPT